MPAIDHGEPEEALEAKAMPPPALSAALDTVHPRCLPCTGSGVGPVLGAKLLA